MPDELPLYLPRDYLNSPICNFIAHINSTHNLSITSYEHLYEWSLAHIDLFWQSVWDVTKIIGHQGSHRVNTAASASDNPPWFKDAHVNWAENMLRHCSSPTAGAKIAVIQAMEPTTDFPNPPLRQVTYHQLYHLVSLLVSALSFHGLRPGDRVASFASNCVENLVACLATTALGGIWVSAAADFGAEGVLERFEQVKPAFIFAVDAVIYNNKVHNHLAKLSAVVAGLRKTGSNQPQIVVFHTIPHPENRSKWEPHYVSWEDFLAAGQRSRSGLTSDGKIDWYRGGFNSPLWILFSSGTTGRPKPIVHRTGGMLLQSQKELAIHGDIKEDDVFFYYTTTGWMMWNFLIGGLACGSTVVLYDGSPLRDPAVMWRLVDDLGITIFGTSAKYLDQLSKNYKPREQHSLKTLRQIYSTGSPLAPELYDYVYEHIHPSVILASITGGTDICSLFAGMCTALPVYRGELQCRMLGMAIQSWTSEGVQTEVGEDGELVCVKPFPCMPLGFWPLPGFGSEEEIKQAEERFRKSYFDEFKGVWYHGDHVAITPSRAGNGGGVIMLGRSDGVLNPGGIRFGSSELYEVINSCFSPPAVGPEFCITDCLAVGQSINNGTDERVVLFVKLLEGQELTEELENKIRREVRMRRSARHVPEKIIQVPSIPYTLNGKLVEVVVKKLINGAPLSTVNQATLSNPGCLGVYVELGEKLRKETD